MTDKRIRFYDEAGAEIAAIPAAELKRFSASAAADHRAMDKMAAKLPSVAHATIGYPGSKPLRFTFKNGRSQLAPGQL